MDLNSVKKIHAIGLGGIGVSALAKYFALSGARVTGSDSFDSAIVRECSDIGIKVIIGHKAKNVPEDVTLIFYSDAVPEDNPERVKARELKIPEISYAQLLGKLSKIKKTIAISGTNGKSTTTAMVGLILEQAGWDPTVIVGSIVPGFKYGNLRLGKSEWLVVEADEYRAHLLELSPEHAIITNIEEDHLDYYRDLAHIKETFFQFAKKINPEGKLVFNIDDPASYELARRCEAELNLGIIRIEFSKDGLVKFSLKVPGRFNVMNALAASALCLSLGIDIAIIRESLENFPGIWRRFEKVGDFNSSLVISDYAHHPTSVAGTLKAAGEFYPNRRILAVFQPHQHNRTKKLFNEFVNSFSGADVLILSEIYDVPGREESEDQDVSSKDLVAAVKEKGLVPDVRYGGNLEETENLIRSMVRAGDVILIMGAGDIDKVARQLCK